MDAGIEVRNQVIFYDFPANATDNRFADPKQLEFAIKKVKSETASLKPIQDAEWFDVTLGTIFAPKKTHENPIFTNCNLGQAVEFNADPNHAGFEPGSSKSTIIQLKKIG